MRDLTVRENEAFHFDVKIIGEPPPDVTWVINNKSIQQTTHRRVQNVPYNSKFFNDKPERKDSGTYKITAVNQHGSDTAEVEVTVICEFNLCTLNYIIVFLNYSIVTHRVSFFLDISRCEHLQPFLFSCVIFTSNKIYLNFRSAAFYI